MEPVNYWLYVLHSLHTWEQWEYGLSVYQLFVDFKKAFDSVESEVWVWYPYEQQYRVFEKDLNDLNLVYFTY